MPVDKLLIQGAEVQQRASEGSAHVMSMETLSKRVDFVGTTVIYIGLAEPGADQADAVWQIKRLTFATDGDISQKYANADVRFTNVWNDRAGLSY